MRTTPASPLGAILVLASFLAVSTAAADVVVLKGGARVEGQVTDRGDAYEVANFSIKVRLGKDQVERVEKQASPFEEYLSRSDAADVQSAAGRFAFAQWCKDKGLKERFVQELHRTLEIDPDFLPARQVLGYEKFKGRWMTPDEIKFEEGFVKHKDRWVRPERAELLAQREAEKERLAVVDRGMSRLAAKMSSPKEKERVAAYEEMLEFGRQYGVLNIEDIASRTREYYDEHYRVQAIIESQYVTLEVHAASADLAQPIRTLPIVQTLDVFGILHTVSIQLPAIALRSADTTVVIPAGS